MTETCSSFSKPKKKTEGKSANTVTKNENDKKVKKSYSAPRSKKAKGQKDANKKLLSQNSSGCYLMECARAALHTKSIAIRDQFQSDQEEGERKRKIKTIIVTTTKFESPSVASIPLQSTDLISNYTPKIIKVKPLLVLDLNGILCHRIRESNQSDIHAPKVFRPSIGRVAGTPIIPRNDTRELLHFLDRHFTLAIWTSATRRTAKELVDLLIPAQIKEQFLFVWSQKQCKVVHPKNKSDSDTSNKQNSKNHNSPSIKTHSSHSISSLDEKLHVKPTFTKSISKVWAMFPLWKPHNTLLIDDSPEKCPPHLRNNCIHPPPIQGLQEMNILNSNVSHAKESQLEATLKERNRQEGDHWNEKLQYIFFEKLVKHFESKNRKEKVGDNFDTERKTLYEFLNVHGRGHMGWQGCIESENEKKA